MRGAPYVNPTLAPPVTGRSFKRIVLAIVCLGLLALVVILAVLKMSGTSATRLVTEAPVKAWKSQTVYEPLPEKAAAQVPKVAEDPNARRLAELENQMRTLLQGMEELKRRRTTTTTVTPAAPAAQPKPPGAPLYIANKVDPATAAASVTEYTLAPGATKLPCEIETAMNSDVEGYFTAKVTTNVYDTATGRHLLVPQGSTILANDQSSQLLYGSERMDTISLKLTLPDGRTVDLGRAPVTDQRGVAGLTGDVNHHYWRLLGAVFIGGALKGGASAMTTAMNTAAGAGQVASGIASVGNQATNRVIGPVLNIRPTITVEAGQLCNVLLLQPLHLPAMWQGGASPEPTLAKTSQTPRRHP